MHRVLKSLYVFIFLLLVFLCGCSSEKSDEKPLVTSFSSNFSASYKEMNLNGNLTVADGGIVELSISGPKTLEGLEVGYRNGEMEIRRENLICSADETYLPNNSFPSVIKEIADGISGGRANFLSENDGEKCYNLKTSDGVCKISCDANGAIKSIEAKSSYTYIEFSQFKALYNQN